MNKFNVNDKVYVKQIALTGHISKVREHHDSGRYYYDIIESITCKEHMGINEFEIELIEQEQHHLIYTLRFDNPYGTNMDGTRQNNTKEGLVEDFIDSLKALMIDSAKRGTFEIPEIKWEYTIIEQDTKEETPEDKTIKIDIPPQKLLVKSEVSGLDYEKEYKLLLEEYEELNEELYIAKTAIKMLSELI